MKVFLKKLAVEEHFDHTHCGRCGDNLPDQTLSYCPTCGILFSQVPPTVEYQLFSERLGVLEKSHSSRKYFFAATLSLGILIVFGIFLMEINRRNQFQDMAAARKIVFYVKDYPQFAKLHPMVKRHAINIAIQSFADHFAFEIRDWEIREDYPPTYLSPDKGLFLNWSQEKELLSFWQKFMSNVMEARWKRSPYEELPVFISNVPLYASDKDSPIETRHLSASKLIGGLGSPGLVIVSSFRLLNELQETDPNKQARYLGEYLLAHELGHALIGIKDSVITQEPSRTLASIFSSPSEKHNQTTGAERTSTPYDQCLMHTDAGGGYYMWEKIQERELSRPSDCVAYQDILEAHQLRELAISQLMRGQREAALQNYEKSFAIIENNEVLSWIQFQWKRERRFYLSPILAWWEELFMFE